MADTEQSATTTRKPRPFIPADNSRAPTDRELKAINQPGDYLIGKHKGLCLKVRQRKNGLSKLWSFRFISPEVIDEKNPRRFKQRETTLGTYEDGFGVTLKAILDLYKEWRYKIDVQRIDPIEESERTKESLKPKQAAPSLWEMTLDYIEQAKVGWAPPPPGRDINREEAYYRGYFYRHIESIRDLPIDQITSKQIADLQAKIWDKPAQEKKCRKKLSTIFGRAIKTGLIPSLVNPADRQTVEAFNRPRSKAETASKPMRSLHWKFVRDLWSVLSEQPDGYEKQIFQMLILHGVRPSEIRTLKTASIRRLNDPYLGEIDVFEAVHHKSRSTYWVPLTKFAKQVLDPALITSGQVYVWASPYNASVKEMPYSDNSAYGWIKSGALGEFWQRHDKFSRHGFRSTLVTWAREHRFGTEIAQSIVGHINGDEYDRSDLIKQKFDLLSAYHYFIETGRTVYGKV
jgi:integrase